MKFRVAVLQMRSFYKEKAQNTQVVITKMEEAARSGADILLLPECFITGYVFPIDDQKVLRADERYPPELCKAAKDIGIGAVETARVLMLKGAEIILVPNDCESMRPRVQALSTRAYENMVGVVMANPNGKNAGCSCAYSPICWDANGECVDNTILLADNMTEGLYYADFDMDKIRCYREREMMGNTFRKLKAYKELLSADVRYPFIRKGQ